MWYNMLYKDKKPTCVASLNSFPESQFWPNKLVLYAKGFKIIWIWKRYVSMSLFFLHLYQKTNLVVNGNASTSFSIRRGCRQGDPISPYLFVMSAEVLACKIREDKTINGIKLADTELKISRFVDDTSFFLKGLNSYKKLFATMDGFERISGLKLFFFFFMQCLVRKQKKHQSYVFVSFENDIEPPKI